MAQVTNEAQLPEYSKRLGVIHSTQFQAALSRFNLGEFVAAEPITQGLFGQNVFVTSTQGRYVLRGSPHYDWQFPKEVLGAALLAQHTDMPVAHPYLLDESEDIFGWSYILMPMLAGIPANSKALSDSDKIDVAQTLANNLAAMQTLAWSFSGTYDLASNTIKPFANSFADWLIADVRNWLAMACQHSDATIAADIAWVDEIIANAQSALRTPFQPCFVMNDYNLGNIAIQSVNAAWRVSGVFDLMEYYFGDGEADLMRLMSIYTDQQDQHLAVLFAQTYLKRRPPRPSFAERFALYMLRDRLITWEFGNHVNQRWFSPGLSLRQYVTPYINLLK